MPSRNLGLQTDQKLGRGGELASAILRTHHNLQYTRFPIL